MNVKVITVCTDSDPWLGYALAVATGIPARISLPVMHVYFRATPWTQRVR